MKRKLAYIIPGLILVGFGAWFAGNGSKSASATGDAYFTLAPTSGTYAVGHTITLAISETSTSGDNTNTVGVNLSFPSSLTWESTNLTGPFTLCAQNSHGSGTVNIACAATSAQSGTQDVATISFDVATGGSNATVAMTSGSNIDNTSGQSVWNGSLPSATYTLQGSGGSSTPTPTPTPTPAHTATPTPSSSGGSVSSSKPSSSLKASTTPSPSSSPGKSASPKPTASTAPTPSPSATPVTAMTSPGTPGSISVTVSDASGRVEGAEVTVSGQTVKTNADGVANFAGIKPNTYQVTVTAPGHNPYTAMVTLGAGQNQLVAYKLTKASGLGTIIIVVLIALIILGAAGGGFWYITAYLPAHLPTIGPATSAPIVGSQPSLVYPATAPHTVMPDPVPSPQPNLPSAPSAAPAPQPSPAPAPTPAPNPQPSPAPSPTTNPDQP